MRNSMGNDRESLWIEVEKALDNKSISEVNFCVKMQRFTMFLYKESTVFWTFFPAFMGAFLIALCTVGPTQETMLLGIIEAILYLPFYFFVVKKIKPFNNREIEFEKIKSKLEILMDYRDHRLSQ